MGNTSNVAGPGEDNALPMNATADSPPPITRSWVLVAPALHPDDEQGRPDLYWNAEADEWAESPDEATEYTDAERAALDLTQFDGDVEWWERLSS